ncbi:MAG: MFS transporter [Candidatus Cloacimonetes bacterium]|nr:MFS transporter [Candidatus Cloacimonadota bacterium]
MIPKNLQLFKFSAYGFLKNQRFFDIFIFLFFLEQGISFLQIGTLIAIREIALLILEIPTGFVADSLGRRKSMIFAFLSYILSFIFFFFFPGFFLYIIAMIFFALGDAFRTGTHKAMILHYLKMNDLLHLKVEYYGYTRSWSQMGSALAALIAGGIVLYSGEYKYIFLCSIIPYILALILMFTYPKELDGERESKEGFLNNITHNFQITFTSLKLSFKEPLLRRALVNSAIFDGLFKTVKDYMQPILKMVVLSVPFLLGINKRESIIISIVYCFFYILTSYASRNSGKLKDRFPSLSVAVNHTYIAGILLVLCAGVFYIVELNIIIIILFIIFFILQNLRRPINIGFISDNISHDVMASGLSVESQLKTIFVAIMSPLMGFIADSINIGAAFIILSSLTLLIFPLIKVSRKVN